MSVEKPNELEQVNRDGLEGLAIYDHASREKDIADSVEEFTQLREQHAAAETRKITGVPETPKPVEEVEVAERAERAKMNEQMAKHLQEPAETYESILPGEKFEAPDSIYDSPDAETPNINELASADGAGMDIGDVAGNLGLEAQGFNVSEVGARA